jgi:hypothetical protein
MHSIFPRKSPIASSEELSMRDHKEGFTAYLVDLDKNTLQLVYKNDTRYIFPVYWDEPNIITLEGLFENENRRFILYLETNEITPDPDW